MGHGRRAHLLCTEGLFRLHHFRALEVSYFHSKLFQGTGNDRQGGKKECMPIPLNNLVGDGVGGESALLTDIGFNFGRDLGEGSHGTGNFSHADITGGHFQPRKIPTHLLIPKCEFQAEGDGLRMDPVGTTDHGSSLIFKGLLAQHLDEFAHIFH